MTLVHSYLLPTGELVEINWLPMNGKIVVEVDGEVIHVERRPGNVGYTARAASLRAVEYEKQHLADCAYRSRGENCEVIANA